MVKKRKNNGRNKKGEHRIAVQCSSNCTIADSIISQAAATSSPSGAPTARDAPPRIRPSSGSPSATWSSLRLSVRIRKTCQPMATIAPPDPFATVQYADTGSLQVISRMPPCSPSTRFPRCTSSCSTASLALSTARLSGTFVRVAGTTASAFSATRVAEKNLGRTSAISCPAPPMQNSSR